VKGDIVSTTEEIRTDSNVVGAAENAPSSSDEASATDKPGETPIPGLLVDVREERRATPIANYEVLTDTDGRLAAAIEVASDSDVIIQSKQENIAKFSVSGSAAEFKATRNLTIYAEPMIEIVGACRIQDGDGAAIRFNYRNRNDSTDTVEVPITVLHPRLYRSDETNTDDLILNQLAYENGRPVIPSISDIINDHSQRFASGEASFTVQYDPSLGALTWRFIGQSFNADDTAPLCTNPLPTSCYPLPESVKQDVFKGLRMSASATLKLASRYWRKGRSPYLKSVERTIRSARESLSLLNGLYVCPERETLQHNCTHARFPFERFEQIHSDMFAVNSNLKRPLFTKLNKATFTRFSKLLRSTVPGPLVRCPR
jgi:hypothetical protein